MKGSAFIKLYGEEDTAYVDIYDTYGVSFIKGSYLKLLAWSGAKDYVKNNSRLTDGVQYIATSTTAKVTEKQATVEVLFEATSKENYVSNLEAFSKKIASGEICLKLARWNRVLRLVYKDIRVKQEYRYFKAIFAIDFVEPNPQNRTTITQQVSQASS